MGQSTNMLHNFWSYGHGQAVRWSPEGDTPIMTKNSFSGKGFEANLLPYQRFRFVSLPEFTLDEVPCNP